MPYSRNIYSKSKKKNRNDRPDHQPGQRMEYERNRKKILASQTVCAICGQPVDKTLKHPHPMSATVDHIIPVSKGGHPSDITNLQLAHFRCNRLKSDHIASYTASDNHEEHYELIGNDVLPLSIDWLKYDGTNGAELSREAEELRRQGMEITARGIRPAGK